MSIPQANEICQQVLKNTIPLRVTVEDQEIPFCFNAPRLISLGIFIHKKLKSFFPVDQEKNIWFSHENTPIKWTLPIGVIYDSLVQDSELNFKPLSIQVNFKNFINDKSLRCESIERAQYYFCHLFKDSINITDGKTDFLTSNKGVHQKMEASLQSGNFEDYLQIFQLRFQNNPVNNWKKWPIKLVTNETQLTVPSLVNAFLDVQEDQIIDDALKFREFSDKKIIVQGIEINPSTKLSEIVPLLINPDGFFYIVLK